MWRRRRCPPSLPSLASQSTSSDAVPAATTSLRWPPPLRPLHMRRTWNENYRRHLNGSTPAGLALSTQGHVVARDVEVRSFGEGQNRLLETVILERDHSAALLADDVVMVVAAGINAFEAGRVPLHVDALNQPQALELLQGPVHGRPAYFGQLTVDLECGQRAALPAQQLDHLPSAAPASEAGLGEGAERAVGPSLFTLTHRATPGCGSLGRATRSKNSRAPAAARAAR